MSAGDRGDAPHPVLAVAAEAAIGAYRDAIHQHTPAQLAEHVADGADGSPSMRIDLLVEDAIIDAVTSSGANVLSEERGWVDRSSALTVVIDPVDGTANAASGVPMSCFSGAVAMDGVFTHALTSWLHTDERWWAQSGVPSYRTSGRRAVAGAAVSLLRPHDRNWEAWSRVARSASRIRVLGCSTMDAVLVATGAIDAFADAGSDTHRLMDLAAAAVLLPAAGGVVLDAHGRPFELDLDLSRRWSGVVAATPELADELCALINRP
jgi:myo-inositol-1(or 4)-monophosphatase